MSDYEERLSSTGSPWVTHKRRDPKAGILPLAESGCDEHGLRGCSQCSEPEQK